MNNADQKNRPVITVKGPEERRNEIKITEGGDPLEEFRQMIKAYSAEAHALNRKKRELVEKLAEEWDIDERKSLELRISTVDAERYEIISDMREIMSYVRERER